MSYLTLNVYNKRIIVNVNDSTINPMDLAEILETEIEEGETSGEVLGFNWYILETRFIMISEKLFEIDEKVEDSFVEKILKQVNNDVVEFEKILEKDFYIDRIGYQNF